MNFLSHFYHELPVNNPYFVAGVILPDILSNYSYRNGEVVKLHVNKLIAPDSNAQAALQRGIKKHYEVDAFFHESTFFQNNTSSITKVLSGLDFACFEKRMYAVSHVLLEIMLDRKILLEDIGSCDIFYAMLEDVNPDEIEILIRNNTSASDASSVATHFKAFRESKFVYDYTNDVRLEQIMNSISKRLGNKPFNENDKELFKIAIDDIQNTLFSQKFPIFRADS